MGGLSLLTGLISTKIKGLPSLYKYGFIAVLILSLYLYLNNKWNEYKESIYNKGYEASELLWISRKDNYIKTIEELQKNNDSIYNKYQNDLNIKVALYEKKLEDIENEKETRINKLIADVRRMSDNENRIRRDAATDATIKDAALSASERRTKLLEKVLRDLGNEFARADRTAVKLNLAIDKLNSYDKMITEYNNSLDKNKREQ